MVEKYQRIWDDAINRLKSNISQQSFDMFFSTPKKVYKVKNNKMYVIVQNNHEQFMLDKFYLKELVEMIAEVSGFNYDVKFITNDYVKNDQQAFDLTKPDPNLPKYYRGNLNTTYTFDRFVAGKSNRLAYMIALQVAERPGEVANPLYIFGGVGLGKTHLMQAIGNFILDDNPSSRILYCTSEKFIDDYRHATLDNNFEAFKEKYRNIDVLLIDDIQFLSKKEQTQTEFFNTFNELYNNNKQIVITSDRPASDLKDIMDRLTSRFEWGLQADIQIPDTQTRIEIMKKKLAGENINLDEFPEEVLEFIASKFNSNVRTLEGALKRLIFYATINNSDFTIELANEALRDLFKAEQKNSKIDVNNIIKEVGAYYDVSVADILSKKRKKNIAYARQVAMFLTRELTGSSFPKIGEAFSGRDHTTIMHGCEKIEKELKESAELKKAVNDLKQALS